MLNKREDAKVLEGLNQKLRGWLFPLCLGIQGLKTSGLETGPNSVVFLTMQLGKPHHAPERNTPGKQHIWFQARPVHGRCCRPVLYFTVQKGIAPMDSGRRHQELFRHDQSPMVARPHPYGQDRAP